MTAANETPPSPNRLAALQGLLNDCDWLKIPQIEQMFAYLKASEADALVLIDYLKNQADPPAVPDGGEIEFGFMLYWIHHPPPALAAWLAKHPDIDAVFACLRQIAPPTAIDCEEYEKTVGAIDQYGVPWIDGTLLGFAHYQQFDTGWAAAPLNYALNLALPGLFLAKFPQPPLNSPPNWPPPIAMTPRPGSGNADPVIGILGDWGTGSYQEPQKPSVACPADRVKMQVTDKSSPQLDYLVHLGDVYYAGTDLFRDPPGEETNNFLSLWPAQAVGVSAGRNFTLNSNHEMYGGANGYFGEALKATAFSAQQGMSYFALTYGKWLVLGLDSAFYSDQGNATPEKPYHFYMAGALGSAALQQQIAWVEQFRGWPGPIMVMTHHNGCDLTGSNVNLLFTQVSDALQVPPALWYWGHLHNGIVYDNLFDAKTRRRFATKARCCGHAAIPFGNGWGLEDRQGRNLGNILYHAKSPDTALPGTTGLNPVNPRVRNGYALVTLRKDGGFTESFYEVDTPQPVWTKTWPAGAVWSGGGPAAAEIGDGS